MYKCSRCGSREIKLIEEDLDWVGCTKNNNIYIIGAPMISCPRCGRHRQWGDILNYVCDVHVVDEVPDSITRLEWEDFLGYVLKSKYRRR